MINKKNYISDLEDQKRAVVGEIERLYREGNCKRQAVMLLVGLTRAIDPLAKRGVKKMNEAREKINPIRNSIQDEDLKRQILRLCNGLKGQLFFEKGSDMLLDRYDYIIAHLKRHMVRHYTDVEYSHRAYHTRTSRYRDIQEYIINSKKLIFKVKRKSKKEEMRDKLKKVNQDIDFAAIKN